MSIQKQLLLHNYLILSNPSVIIISNQSNANITASKTVGGNPKFNISFNLGALCTQFSYTFNKLY